MGPGALVAPDQRPRVLTGAQEAPGDLSSFLFPPPRVSVLTCPGGTWDWDSPYSGATHTPSAGQETRRSTPPTTGPYTGERCGPRRTTLGRPRRDSRVVVVSAQGVVPRDRPRRIRVTEVCITDEVCTPLTPWVVPTSTGSGGSETWCFPEGCRGLGWSGYFRGVLRDIPRVGTGVVLTPLWSKRVLEAPPRALLRKVRGPPTSGWLHGLSVVPAVAPIPLATGPFRGRVFSSRSDEGCTDTLLRLLRPASRTPDVLSPRTPYPDPDRRAGTGGTTRRPDRSGRNPTRPGTGLLGDPDRRGVGSRVSREIRTWEVVVLDRRCSESHSPRTAWDL